MFATIFCLSVKGLGRFTTRASGLLSTAIAGGAVVSFLMGVVKDNSTWPPVFGSEKSLQHTYLQGPDFVEALTIVLLQTN